MGKLIAVLIPALTVWGALAQIMPDVFQLRRDNRANQFLWGSKSIWIAAISVSCLVAWYVWRLEDRLSALTRPPVASVPVGSTDGSSIKFALWAPFPDGTGCVATIDASKLPMSVRNAFEIALVCGFSDPTIDRVKDTRISVSQLFTPEDAVSISVPFSKVMADGLAADQEAAIKKIQPPPRRGTPLAVGNQLWMMAVLLPKGMDSSNIRRIADVTTYGGKITEASASVTVTRQVIAK